jgi:hypothetical protein
MHLESNAVGIHEFVSLIKEYQSEIRQTAQKAEEYI